MQNTHVEKKADDTVTAPATDAGESRAGETMDVRAVEAVNPTGPDEMSGVVIVEFGEMPTGTLLDEAAMAALLRTSKRTVRRMVGRGELPPAIRLGGRSTWLSHKVLEHLTERAVRAARERERRHGRN